MKSIVNVQNRFEKIIANLGLDVGIDLGSNNLMIYLKDRGVVVNEPTMVARLKRKRWMGLSAPQTGKLTIIAYGQKAKEMRSKEPIQMEVMSAIKNGIVNDLEVAEKVTTHFLRYVYEIPSKYPKFLKPRVVAGVPCTISDVQKRALKTVFRAAGAREVTLIEDAILAAIGAGLPIESNAGLMIVDIGGGKTEVSVVSMGGIVVTRGTRIAGNDFDEAIINFVKMKYGLLIGPNTAEKVKIELGEVVGDENKKTMIIRGRDLETGLPKSIKITQGEVREALIMIASRVVKLVKEVLDQTPPELVEDILKRGIVMVGRGSNLKGIDKLIEADTKITTRIVDEPEMTVIRGCGKLIEDRSWLSRIRMVNQS